MKNRKVGQLSKSRKVMTRNNLKIKNEKFKVSKVEK